MDVKVKRKLTELSKNKNFSDIFKKLILEEELVEKEKSFILSCALLFLNFYEKDNRFRTYLEVSYYIILKYSLSYNDYKPLYDFSLNAGFFPTVNFILNNGLLDRKRIHDVLIQNKLEDFKDSRGDFVQTLEQFNKSKDFLNDNSKKKCYIAPTSYGKSSIVIDYIEKYNNLNKIAIIVPTKSLLNQTYKLVKNNIVDRKLLIHNEMYNNEERFIAIFTQERALKFLEKNKPIFFDLLVIDEAHNIFDSDSRNILLSRLVKRNQKLNENHEIIYLSPLIEDKNSLKLFKNDIISSNLIKFNIKEPTYYEYLKNGEVFVFNHFLKKFYKIDKIENKFNYILKNSCEKNFLFENSPRKIEILALELSNSFKKIESKEIDMLKEIMIKETHKNFHIIKLLDYGIVYLHGKIPTIIKDFLEEKFDKVKELKFIVANTVILEGINLPVDNMFIMNLHNVSMKQLVNLIGRVNRLNTIFTNNESNLKKLNPKIHFINKKEYAEGHNPKLLKLRNRFFEDKIKNPILINQNEKSKDKNKDLSIKRNEDFLNTDCSDEFSKIKRYFIENSLNIYYDDLDLVLDIFLKNYNEYKSKDCEKIDTFDLIFDLFIKNLIDNITDLEFLRLQYDATRNYYKSYVEITSKIELRHAIKNTLDYFKKKSKSNNPLLYVGAGYGEVKYKSSKYDGKQKVYVDLSLKSEYQLINLIIVKLKMEEDFTSFTLNKFVEALFDLNIISEFKKDKFIYGSNDKSEQKLFKLGLSKKIIQQLKITSQIDNLSFDEFGNISYNQEFEKYIDSLDEFKKFELKKHF